MTFSHKYLLTFCFFIPFALLGQEYSIDKNTTDYANLSGEKSLIYADAGQPLNTKIELPFSFPFFGKNYNKAWIGEGYISFDEDRNLYIDAVYADLMVGNETRVLHQVIGKNGNRIFKLEWNHLLLTQDATGTSFVNAQLWLYEGSGKIEVHYGNCSYLPEYMNNGLDETGPTVGIAKEKTETYFYATDEDGKVSPYPSALKQMPSPGAVISFTAKVNGEVVNYQGK